MAWRKSPPVLIDLFDRAVPADPRVERRKMFGYPAAFVNGHLFAGLHQEDLVLRLGENDRASLLAKRQAMAWEPMPGRRMREYVALAPGVRGNVRAVRRLLAKSLAFAATLPVKPQRKTPSAGSTKTRSVKRSLRDRPHARQGTV